MPFWAGRTLRATVPARRHASTSSLQFAAAVPPFFVAHLFGSPLSPAHPSFRALSGRLKFTVRRHKFNKFFSLFGRWRLGYIQRSPRVCTTGVAGFCGVGPRKMRKRGFDLWGALQCDRATGSPGGVCCAPLHKGSHRSHTQGSVSDFGV